MDELLAEAHKRGLKIVIQLFEYAPYTFFPFTVL